MLIWGQKEIREEKGAQSAPQKRVKGGTKRNLGRLKQWRKEGENKNMMHKKVTYGHKKVPREK